MTMPFEGTGVARAARRVEASGPDEQQARSEARWYADIRRALVLVRRRAGLDQTALAKVTGRHQSEISRVENGLSDRTRLGTIRRHVEGCGGTLGIVVLDRDGRVVLNQIGGVSAWPESGPPAHSDAATEATPGRAGAHGIDPAKLEAALRPVIAGAAMTPPERGSLMDAIFRVVHDMGR
jgi:hypothetical protein